MSPTKTNDQRLQIETIIEERYFPIIQKTKRRCSEEEHRKNRLSRSLAALAIEKLANIDPVQAANAVVDEHNDNGIDAVYYDRSANKLFLIQSKISNAPNMGENKKFCDGVKDLVGGRFEKFQNKGFARIKPDVEDALDADNVQVLGGLVYLGEQLGSHSTADLDQLKSELNQFWQRFSWENIGFSKVYRWLTEEKANALPDITLKLLNWSALTSPRAAFYGLVKASQLAELYQTHGNKLFEKNIRYYLGAQGINSAIEKTLKEKPEELFYLNNGITAICSEIRPNLGAKSEEGTFNLAGFSIVNGAQTVGSLSRAYPGASQSCKSRIEIASKDP
jgi:hypothetical protein